MESKLLSFSLDKFRNNHISLSTKVEADLIYIGEVLPKTLLKDQEHEKSLLKLISRSLESLGYHYGDKDSPIDRLSKLEVNCEGFCFLYGIIAGTMRSITDNLDAPFRLEVYHTVDLQKSHVNLLDKHLDNYVWETTLTEESKYINPYNIYQLGYRKHSSKDFHELFSFVDSFIITHFKNNSMNQDIVSYVNEMSLYKDKYPLPTYYLKEKFQAINSLYNSNEISLKDFYVSQEGCLRSLLSYEPLNTDFKINLLSNILSQVDDSQRLSLDQFTIIKKLNESLDILDSFNKEEFMHDLSYSLARFFKAHTFLNLYIQTNEAKYSDLCLSQIHLLQQMPNVSPQILLMIEKYKKILVNE